MDISGSIIFYCLRIFSAFHWALWVFGNYVHAQPKVQRMPNIVLIVVDDLGYGDLGIYGNPDHETPHMDMLAREGLLFTDFHSNAPVCSPTRAAIMTGQYQQRAGIESAIGFDKEEGMALEKRTIAEILGQRGYTCGVFGKWHLGYVERFGPNDQGFDHSVVSNNTPDYHTHISRIGEYDWFRDHKRENEPGYLTTLITNHSVRFMQANKNRPFFLFISHIAVHFPFQGPDDPPHRTPGRIWHDTKYGPLPENQYRRAYREMLEAADESVGKVVAALRETGLRNNTLILITSDNGAYAWVGSNYPYRGQKGDLFEGGHRVPAIANWPGRIFAGRITNVPAMTMDIAPTLISLTGGTTSEDIQFDGIDLSPVLFEGADLPRRDLFWRFNNRYDNSRAFAVRRDGWKYMEAGDKQFLFNLHQDPTERHNLIDEYNDVAMQLESAYRGWLMRVE